jgi:hypothetical protein
LETDSSDDFLVSKKEYDEAAEADSEMDMMNIKNLCVYLIAQKG